MNYIFIFVVVLILIIGIINLLRIALLLIGSDIYLLLIHLQKKRNRLFIYPKISVIIPAHNEDKTIKSAVLSVIHSNYPQEKLDVIVVDDGSTDNTSYIVQKLQQHYKNSLNLIVLDKNLGKAHALNIGMQSVSESEIVMCLDADSQLDAHAVKNAVQYFKDPKVMAVASNVHVIPAKRILNIIQLYEYIVCYQMKSAHSNYNIEYIIGGIGSTFRRSFIEKIGYYDENTVTEDIDLTMKILRNGNKNIKIMYGSDIITYTQGALTLRDLMKQRLRWKWGRYQAFYKNKDMFFSKDKKFTKGLSWVYLPYALFADIAFLFEPIVVGFIIGSAVYFRDPFTILSAFTVMTLYVVINILAEESIAIKNKVLLILFSPVIYIMFYVLSFVEYYALIRSFMQIHTLGASLKKSRYTWEPIKRVVFS